MSKKNNAGQRLWQQAKGIIPGGNQLLSKRAEMYLPDQWPAYYSRARGAQVWDLDGNRFYDLSTMGVGSCMLGYADPDVDRAVIRAIRLGSMATLNVPEEVELARLLCELHPWAEMVRYARTGGESMAIAARIARAYTGRDTIAFCGYHGWADWYLAANLRGVDLLSPHLLKGLEPKGVPKGLRGTMLPFRYNKIEELEQIAVQHKKLAAIVMEPIHGEEPRDNFLQKVRAIAKQTDAVLVFDEITMGFRLTLGGAHLRYGVEPDLAVFAKGMSNGYPMAAIIGRQDVMQAAQDTFISSTFWTERIGPVAALASIQKMHRLNLPKRLEEKGYQIKRNWEHAAEKHAVPISVSGVPPMLFFSFTGNQAQALKTLFTQEMLDRGFLASTAVYATMAHTDPILARYGKVVEEVFGTLRQALDAGAVAHRLRGPVAHVGFERLN